MKNIRNKKERKKEVIIAEYLNSRTTYRKLGLKYGIDYTIIHKWVKQFQGNSLIKRKPVRPEYIVQEEKILPTDVKQLQEELRKAKLYNDLLNTMIDIAEDQLKIDIRKKSGTKR